MVTMFKQGTLCKMVTTFDSGFTAEKDINAYNKAAFQAKARTLGFNKEKNKRFRLTHLGKE